MRRIAGWANGRGRYPWRYGSVGEAWLLGLGFNRLQDLWQADHVRPRCEGGGDELTNLRTLCVPCHKRETAELAARRARERRDGAAALFQEQTEAAV